MKRTFMSLTAVATLGACGGSSVAQLDTTLLPAGAVNAGNVRVSTPDTQVYNEIEENGTGVSKLEGIGAVRTTYNRDVSPEISRVYVYGTRDAATGRVVLTETLFLFEDADGDDDGSANIRYETADGNAEYRFLTASFGQAANYDYARHFIVSNDEIDAAVMLGVTTAASDMPQAGTTTFSGDSFVTTSFAGGSLLRRDTATLDVDFANGLVDAMLGSGLDSGFSDISVEDMVISGNGFAGGTVTLLDSGMDVTEIYTGGSRGTDAAGLFFGPISATSVLSNFDGPAEAGGVISVGGNTHSVEAFFLTELD